MKSRALLLFGVISAANALYFTIQKEGHRCFLVDVPKDTTFRAEYESPDTTDVMKTIVAIYAPKSADGKDEKTQVKSEQTNQKGSIMFTATENGPHWVCISLDSSNYALPDRATMRFTLKLSMGTSHEEYQNLAKKNQMDDLQLEVLKLRDRVTSIQRNQDYAKNKSMGLHLARKVSNSRATWMSVIQIVILLVTGFYQAKHLKAYFHVKKLV
ncbi:transmembrane emp24 domain-containing protein 4 [Plasmopara halstedii]|uniref:Transmembrane emp24 domain-containing protein 4 n=1 Tax=Plasmopara halstedii TaxID=4781 RepID=A0A0P1A7D7_PLAHL|nr:transmembrane emp24 domain-containing protein 4 [Plasmopara halstedii]CEG36176.1 transmembrane emp24 domain-containing protein 4 [Plasmopara halstedii]|eukprot:XP_024572545.1 transmembrane emp24 domain-containing protein 4 [Plasmopara halstedii]